MPSVDYGLRGGATGMRLDVSHVERARAVCIERVEGGLAALEILRLELVRAREHHLGYEAEGWEVEG